MIADIFSWAPGAILIVIGGLYGYSFRYLLKTPPWRKRVWFVHWLLLALGGLFVVVGVILRLSGHDDSCANAWLMPGAIFVVVMASMIPFLRNVICKVVRDVADREDS